MTPTPHIPGAEIADARLRELEDELVGETGEKVIGKQTLYRIITELLAAREALAVPEGVTRYSLFEDGMGVDPNGPYVLYADGSLPLVTSDMVEAARQAHGAVFKDILQERTIHALAPERQEANDKRMMRAALEAALANVPPQVNEAVACERCQGNGEIVTDWERYRSPHPDDKGDEAVAECPDCYGTGKVNPARTVKLLVWTEYPNEYYPDVFGHCWDATTPFGRYEIAEASASDTPYYNVCRGTEFVADCDGLPDAKAAAQADYEQRIRSALASPSPGTATARASDGSGLETMMLEETSDALDVAVANTKRATERAQAAEARVERLETALSESQASHEAARANFLTMQGTANELRIRAERYAEALRDIEQQSGPHYAANRARQALRGDRS